jgi:hypothetical protein
MFLLVVDDAGKHKVFPQAELICRRSLLIKSKQFANPSLTGSSLSLYSSKVFTRFWGGFDIYASVLLTPSCFLFKQ